MMYIQLAIAVLAMYFEFLTLFVDKLKIVLEKFGQAVSSVLWAIVYQAYGDF